MALLCFTHEGGNAREVERFIESVAQLNGLHTIVQCMEKYANNWMVQHQAMTLLMNVMDRNDKNTSLWKETNVFDIIMNSLKLFGGCNE